MEKWIILTLVGLAGVYCQNNASTDTQLEAALATNSFGLDLLRTLSPDGENGFFSPLSIAIALAMTSLGSRGNTLQEIENALHFSKINRSSSETNFYHEDFQNVVTSFSQQHTYYNLSLANRLFAQHDIVFNKAFLNDVSNYYKASVKDVDFKAGQVEEIINEWVKEQTHGCIKEIFKPGSLDEQCVLVLVNAIYFKGNWKIKFNPDKTENADFYVTTNETVTTKLMEVTEYFPYAYDRDLEIQVLEMPYSGDDLSMIVILPKEGGISKVISQLTAEKLKTLFDDMNKTKVKVKFPKFKLELEYPLKDTLEELGITDLFDSNRADLSGMCNVSLTVSKVIHKSFVEVTEEGTEAAAVTAVVSLARSGTGREIYPYFIVNRPFLFFIVKKDVTHRMLFVGVVNHPKYSSS